MSEEMGLDRRRFGEASVMGIVVPEHDMLGAAGVLSSRMNPAEVPPIKPGTNTSFGALKQIMAGVLDVG